VGELIDLRPRLAKRERAASAYDALLAAVASVPASGHQVPTRDRPRRRHLSVVGTLIRFPEQNR